MTRPVVSDAMAEAVRAFDLKRSAGAARRDEARRLIADLRRSMSTGEIARAAGCTRPYVYQLAGLTATPSDAMLERLRTVRRVRAAARRAGGALLTPTTHTHHQEVAP